MGKGFETLLISAKAAEQFGETVTDLKSAEIFAVCANGHVFHLRNIEARKFSATAIDRKKLVAWLRAGSPR